MAVLGDAVAAFTTAPTLLICSMEVTSGCVAVTGARDVAASCHPEPAQHQAVHTDPFIWEWRLHVGVAQEINALHTAGASVENEVEQVLQSLDPNLLKLNLYYAE